MMKLQLRMKSITAILISTVLLLISLSFIKPVFALEKIDVTTVDSPINTNYGTFQSHNQKVVSNKYGIFMTHLHSRNDAYDVNTWRLSRSTDGGKLFTTVYESVNGTSAPAIETDSRGVVYLAHPDWGVGYSKQNILFYRFQPEKDFRNPAITTITGGAAGKYSMMLDEPRQQLYYFSHVDDSIYVFSIDGSLKRSYRITQPGTSAGIQYPYFYLEPNGTLYAAWTTVKHGEYMYWSIHVIKSGDGGISWKKLDGTQLFLPIVVDETGPTDRITLDDESNVHTWLWTIIVKNGKAHFAYMAQSNPARQHYVRHDLSSGKKDRDNYPDWNGETISLLNLDGFCATKQEQPDSPIYCTSRTRDNRLGTIVSYDNGDTWHDFAQSDFSDQVLYSIGGAREITDDGYVIGSYTDSKIPTSSAVRFFRIKVSAASRPTLTPTLTLTPNPTDSILCPKKSQGDANCDEEVDGIDYSIWLRTQCRPSGSARCADNKADYNNDGNIDDGDYLTWFRGRN